MNHIGWIDVMGLVVLIGIFIYCGFRVVSGLEDYDRVLYGIDFKRIERELKKDKKLEREKEKSNKV